MEEYHHSIERFNDLEKKGDQMRLDSLPFSDDLKRAIYEALNPEEPTSDKNVIGNFDLCTTRGKNHSDQLVGSANSATDFRYRSKTSTTRSRAS